MRHRFFVTYTIFFAIFYLVLVYTRMYHAYGFSEVQTLTSIVIWNYYVFTLQFCWSKMEVIPPVAQATRADIGVQGEGERRYFEEHYQPTTGRDYPVAGIPSHSNTSHNPKSGAVVYKDHGILQIVPVSHRVEELRPFETNRQFEAERNTLNDINDSEPNESKVAARVAGSKRVTERGAKIPKDR